MSIFDRRRTSGTSSGGKSVPVELALPPVLAVAREAVERFEHAEIEAALLRAQLADRCRDTGVEPVAPEALDGQVRELDGDGWRRLAALAALWAPQDPGAALAAVLRQRGAGFAIGALVAVARGKPLLTLAVLRMSALRVEELVRAQLGALGIAIAGETAAQSVAALQRLDYERLLAQAEQARQAAESRLAQLKQAQDEDDKARNPRRGKW